jgi:hypothetical protein
MELTGLGWEEKKEDRRSSWGRYKHGARKDLLDEKSGGACNNTVVEAAWESGD